MIKLDRAAPFPIDDPKEVGELQRALSRAVFLAIDPESKSVWQLEDCEIRGGNVRLVKDGRAELSRLVDMVDDRPSGIAADPTH